MGKSTIKNKRAEIMVIVISAVLVAVIFTMLIRFNKNNNLIIPSFGFIVSIPPIIKINMNLKSVIDYVEKIIL